MSHEIRASINGEIGMIDILFEKQGVKPERIVTDKLRSYGAALKHLGQQPL